MNYFLYYFLIMELIDVRSLYLLIANVVKQKRQDVTDFDGKAFWQPIKKILSTSDWQASWKQSLRTVDLPEFDSDGSMIENNHFLIQIVRIPKTTPPSLRKIMQIALNSGQYAGNTHHGYIIEDITNFITTEDSKVLLVNILTTAQIQDLIRLL